jgi:pimeloyl-ACP methyl ester carboxylesterase
MADRPAPARPDPRDSAPGRADPTNAAVDAPDSGPLPPLWHERMGRGPLVLLLHGLSDTHDLWQHVAPALAERSTVVSIDHYAHGRSPVPAGQLTTAVMADGVGQLIERLAMGPAVVIGLSMGGGVAQVLALRRPDLVRALGLVSTSSAFKPANRERFRARGEKALREGMAAVIDETVPRWFTADWPAANPEAYQAVVDTVLANPPERFAAASHANAERDWTDRLGEIRCPVLFVGGEQDPMGIEPVAASFREHIPGTRTVIVPAVSHLIPIQKPAELNAILLDWLAEVAPHQRR